MQRLLDAKNQQDSVGRALTGEATASARIGGLDAVRGLAVIAGVVLHASVSYMPRHMHGLLWPVHDRQTTMICHYLFWWLHTIRLPLFFVISGFVSELLCESRGVDAFLQHRFRRIAIPFLVGLMTVLPVTAIIWGIGLNIDLRCSFAQALAFTTPFKDPEVQENYFGPIHLWFLADLTIISVAFALIRREFAALRGTVTTAAFRLPHPVLAPLVPAVPTLLLLWGNLSPFLSHHNTFIPDTARLSYYGLYFLAGVIAYRRKEHALELLNYPLLHLPLSLVASVATLMLLPNELAGESTAFHRFLLGTSVSLAAWLSIFGLMGLVLRYGKADRPAFRYLADASYWIYIIHLPVVGLSNIALQQLSIGAVSKFLSTSVISLSIALMSYQTLVRYTWIGRALHGSRARGIGPGEPESQPGAHQGQTAAHGQPGCIPLPAAGPNVPTFPGERRAA